MASDKARNGDDSELYDRLIAAGAEISKTGGVRVDLGTLVNSENAKRQLDSIKAYKVRQVPPKSDAECD